ncbi:hypothetical protein FF1_003428 [Malus domestica]
MLMARSEVKNWATGDGPNVWWKWRWSTEDGTWNSGDVDKPRGHGGSSRRGAEDGSSGGGEGRPGCGLVDGIRWIGVDFMPSETPVIGGLLKRL